MPHELKKAIEAVIYYTGANLDGLDKAIVNLREVYEAVKDKL